MSDVLDGRAEGSNPTESLSGMAESRRNSHEDSYNQLQRIMQKPGVMCRVSRRVAVDGKGLPEIMHPRRIVSIAITRSECVAINVPRQLTVDALSHDDDSQSQIRYDARHTGPMLDERVS